MTYLSEPEDQRACAPDTSASVVSNDVFESPLCNKQDTDQEPIAPLSASLSAPITLPTAPGPQTEEFLRTIACDLVDKQYRLYSWNDTKTEALITTNSVLFAAVGFLYKECLGDFLAMTLLGLGTACLGSSLIICLIQVIPRISSGKTGSGPNTRSLRGIGLYKTFEEYYAAFMRTTKASILLDTVRQIYGMANNNLRSAKIIKRGVSLTLCGIIAILGAVYTSAIGARGHHALGKWQTDSSEHSPGMAADPTPVVSRPLSPSPAPSSGVLPLKSSAATPSTPGRSSSLSSPQNQVNNKP